MIAFINITDTDGIEYLININNIVVIEICKVADIQRAGKFVITMNYAINTTSYNQSNIYTNDNIIEIISNLT